MQDKPVSYWGLRLKEDSIEMGWGTFAILGFIVALTYHGPWAR